MKSFTVRVAWEWAVRCFGIEHVANPQVRALRFAEEAIELGQALTVPKEQMLRLVEVVYSRPIGVPRQEVGGCMVTLAVLCQSLGIDPQGAFEDELIRVLAKSEHHFAKRNSEKIELGLGR